MFVWEEGIIMVRATKVLSPGQRGQKEGIKRIIVSGFKSIANEQTIAIKPLTLLAGANSSGKSSFMQPLLMLKQTLESDYDPGPLRLDGPNVTFSSTDQFLSFGPRGTQADSFCAGVEVAPDLIVRLCFRKSVHKGLVLKEMRFEGSEGKGVWREGDSGAAVVGAMPKDAQKLVRSLASKGKSRLAWSVSRRGCFLYLSAVDKGRGRSQEFPIFLSPGAVVGPHIQQIIHIPGHRGHPERTYQKTAVGRRFKGSFHTYVASVIAKWQDSDRDNLSLVGEDLERLGLTWKVQAHPIDDVKLELMVGRLLHRTVRVGHEVVNIADVGFGVSQALPVVVALRAAVPGQY
jgi:hypothetical protein